MGGIISWTVGDRNNPQLELAWGLSTREFPIYDYFQY